MKTYRISLLFALSVLISVRATNAQDDIDAALILESKGQWQSAAQTLLKCIQARPDLETAWIELGRCYMKVKDFDSAEKTLMQAQKRFAGSPTKQKSILLMLMRFQAEAGQLEALQQSRRTYLTEFPTAEDAKVVREEIEYYEKDYADTRRRESGRPEPPLDTMPSMPIKVYTAPDKVIASGNTIYTKAVSVRYAALAKKALNEWASATDQLSFVVVDSPTYANVDCEWTTDLTKRENSFASGEANSIPHEATGTISATALIFLDAKNMMSDSEFYDVCLHELGHALGLKHSSHPEDIMYWTTSAGPDHGRNLRHLSKGDISRIRMFYSDRFQARKIALDFAQAAYVKREYEKAYDFLSPAERAKISVIQFQQQIEKDHPASRPLSLQVIHETLLPDLVEFKLLGTNGEEMFYYDVAVHADGGAFQVDQSRRVAGTKLRIREHRGQKIELEEL